MSEPAPPPRLVSWKAVGAIGLHPSLWMTALVQARRMAPRSWWRQWPPRPQPSADYAAFRLQTQQGSDATEATADDLVAYLRWCRDWNRYRSV